MRLFALFLCIMTGALFAADGPAPIPKDTLPAAIPFDPAPLGLPPIPAPSDNPPTPEKVALGRKLFFDPILSTDNTVACASCHHPDKAFGGGEATSKGIRGQATKRKAPSLVNRAYGSAFFWDGRVKSLEEQALKPIEDPTEMGSKLPAVLARLKADEKYSAAFGKAFPGEDVSAATLAKAIASFERALLRGNAPVDRFQKKGERSALSAEEIHGFWLFDSKARCWRCHGGANFTDDSFRNTGVSWGKDAGRVAVTKDEADRGKFKIPTLRGIGVSGPFMHDGSLKTLADVVDFYNRGGGANPNRDPALAPLGLTAEEKRALVAFLKTL
ncbi:MAG TPA: cytochrome c peroxidase [Fimbriiglobus sp.]|jgi:cytochrome c peroxidase